jgi:hypothetical protein
MKEVDKLMNENEYYHVILTWILISVFLILSGISIGNVKINKFYRSINFFIIKYFKENKFFRI